jgi:hypothetical protein
MKVGRNDPCHCGSGKKYKKCHLAADEAAETAAYAAKAAEAAANAAAAAKEEAEGAEGKEGKASQDAPKRAPIQEAPRKPKGGAGPQPSPIRRKAV